MLPRKTPRCRQRRNPTRATSVPTRRIPTVHREVRTVLTPTISVVSQSVRIWTMPRSTAAFHRSKPEASACEARTRPTIATRTVARATQTLPLTPRLRGRGGGSPEGRRRRPRPPGPRCGAMLRLGEVPAASVAMADATAAVQARDTAISALIPPSGLQAGPAVALGALEHQYNTGKVEGSGPTGTQPTYLLPPFCVSGWLNHSRGDPAQPEGGLDGRAVAGREDAAEHGHASAPPTWRVVSFMAEPTPALVLPLRSSWVNVMLLRRAGVSRRVAGAGRPDRLW